MKPNMATMVRLERLLANRGYCARSSVGGFLRAHDVRSAGRRLMKPDERVNELSITIGGDPVDPATILLVMHKPVGLTCSHREPGESGGVVYDLLPERYRRRDPVIATVGRLDKETSGVLLLTDDGQLLHRLTSPKHHCPRVYLATLDRDLRGDEGTAFGSGTMMLEGEKKPLLPAGFEAVGKRQARVTLQEGRYHQVRRMFAAMGNHVVTLHREHFGPIHAAGLGAGEWRRLKPEELSGLIR